MNNSTNTDSSQNHVAFGTWGWIRNPAFDITLIVGVASLSLLSAAFYMNNYRLFYAILFLDLWLLGYHHVIATFTRLSFDLESFKENKFLVVWVPVIIIAIIIPSILLTGPWVLATAYLYWQWYHYTRQSYGIARIYQRRIPDFKNNLIEEGMIYAVPVLGILYRSYHIPSTFLGVSLKCLPVPLILIQAAGIITAVIFILWIYERYKFFKKGKLEKAFTLYNLSHVVIFVTGYILIRDINYGWLMVNIWHNAQYILFVWMYNNNRFKKGIDPKHRFLSILSQNKNIIWYFAVCLAITTIVFQFIDGILAFFTVSTLPLAIVVYQAINFHHYVVDGLIWKIRKKSISQTLGIAN